MFGGFHGAVLKIDLSSGRSTRSPLGPGLLQETLGGVGLANRLLAQESPPGVDALDPEAAVVIAFGPLGGTAVTTSAKFAVAAKSPLTGQLSDGLSSSDFALAGKAMGIDAIVITGRAPVPSVWREGVLEATECWGLSAAETESRLGAPGRVLAIGPAGEAAVRYATLSNGGRHAGRGGLGAVFGSKRLKAIVMGGGPGIETPVAEPRVLAEQARRLARETGGSATAKYRELGTVGNLATFDRLGMLPTHNFQRGRFAGADSLMQGALSPEGREERRSCAHCTIGCEHRYGSGTEGPQRVEYESLFALGPLCGIDDSEVVLEAIRRCDALGMDTISTGASVAFAMECRQRGWLPEAPRFGDGPGLLDAIEAVGCRRGLGDRLAEGTRRLATELGPEALAIAPQVKGMELPGYEPRALHAQALGFAVGGRGADHNRSGAYEVDFSDRADRLRGDERAAVLAAEAEDRAAVMDSLILCKFLRGAFDDFYGQSADLVQAVTGWRVGAADLRAVGRRIVDERKRFNVREGWRPEHDTLPARFLDQALEESGAPTASLSRERLSRMIRAYNEERGWSPEGYPKPAPTVGGASR